MTVPGYNDKNEPRFSRRWFLRRVRNFLWVALITVMIWVFADMQLTQSREMTAVVRLTAPKARSLVLLEQSGTDGALREVGQKDVELAFSAVGSRHSLEAFERELRNPIRYDVAKDHSPGLVRIPTMDILNDFAGEIHAGLTFRAPEPNVVSVILDRQVRRELPVELSYTGATLEDVPNLTVTVTVAQQLWERIQSVSEPPTLKTVTQDLAGYETGQPIEVTFRIIPQVAGVPVEPERTSVPVTLQISQRTQPKTMTVAVRLLAPAAWFQDGTWERYEVVGKEGEGLEWRKEITVSGPKKDLEQLEAKDIDAYVPLKEQDKAPVSWLTREVVIRFPPHLAVTLVDGPPTVSFKLLRRETTAPAQP